VRTCLVAGADWACTLGASVPTSRRHVYMRIRRCAHSVEAGAGSVRTLLGSPPAIGLFQGAIFMSNSAYDLMEGGLQRQAK
jgi:hypothetical protein